jgi:hypothetical protein
MYHLAELDCEDFGYQYSPQEYARVQHDLMIQHYEIEEKEANAQHEVTTSPDEDNAKKGKNLKLKDLHENNENEKEAKSTCVRIAS